MNVIELQRALRQLRLGGMAVVLETRLRQAQADGMAPIDLISCLVADELTRRCDRLLERRRKQAAFRDPDKTLDNFDFTFNPKMNRSLVFDLACVLPEVDSPCIQRLASVTGPLGRAALRCVTTADPWCQPCSHSLPPSAFSSAIAPTLLLRFWRFASK